MGEVQNPLSREWCILVCCSERLAGCRVKAACRQVEAACQPLGKLALIIEKRSCKGAELIFVRTSQGSQGAVKPGLYFNLVREMDLSPRREGARTGGNQAPKVVFHIWR